MSKYCGTYMNKTTSNTQLKKSHPINFKKSTFKIKSITPKESIHLKNVC